MEVAKKAHDDGLWVVAGAPNVMLGGSHAGNLNAEEAIRAGHVDILCSDLLSSGHAPGCFPALEKRCG